MDDSGKTREQLISELAELRREIDILRGDGRGHGDRPFNEVPNETADRELIEDELRESEEKYRSLVESTDDSIYLVDKKCRYLFINKKHLSRIGVRIEEVLGRPYGDFHAPEETAEFVRYVNKVLRTGESAQYEHRSMRDGGYFLWTMGLSGTGEASSSRLPSSQKISHASRRWKRSCTLFRFQTSLPEFITAAAF